MAQIEAHVLEHHVQTAVVQYLAAAGWATWRIGQRNAKGTQDAGVPDIHAMHERWGAMWVECKRPVGGRQSAAQKQFEQWCMRTRQTYVLAPSVDALRVALARRSA